MSLFQLNGVPSMSLISYNEDDASLPLNLDVWEYIITEYVYDPITFFSMKLTCKALCYVCTATYEKMRQRFIDHKWLQPSTYTKTGKLQGYRTTLLNTIIARYKYANGLREGEAVGLYFNSHHAFVAHYIKGRLEGDYKAWYVNKNLAFIIPYKYGRRHGTVTTWHKNGQIEFICEYRHNIKHGWSLEYTSQGQLLKEKKYFFGVRIYQRKCT